MQLTNSTWVAPPGGFITFPPAHNCTPATAQITDRVTSLEVRLGEMDAAQSRERWDRLIRETSVDRRLSKLETRMAKLDGPLDAKEHLMRVWFWASGVVAAAALGLSLFILLR